MVLAMSAEQFLHPRSSTPNSVDPTSDHMSNDMSPLNLRDVIQAQHTNMAPQGWKDG
jgi:hypothetical protein